MKSTDELDDLIDNWDNDGFWVMVSGIAAVILLLAAGFILCLAS